ncbi:MAG: hypothetical protein OXG33_09145 [Chloroflexi bacterium]|nr:hypothetical protein [Chloroflexota bacterium]
METKDLCMALMRADTEEEVVSLLQGAGYWSATECWRPVGDKPNNLGTIGNQQGEAIAALVEKIVNGIDARLTNACLLSGINPEGPQAPRSIREAVAQFFGGRSPNSHVGGRISDWLDPDVTKESRLLTVAATGMMPGHGRPSITIADQGEGQTPDSFPDTFMSLDQSNKDRIPFVQGRFNMGGTGAFPFCGNLHRLQLIVSRRNPVLIRSSDSRDHHWGFTIVRREPPPPGTKNSVYTYLAPKARPRDRKRSVLSFAAPTWPIFPESNNQVRDAYIRHSPYGSLVKLYEYNWQGTTSNIVLSGGGLLSRINVGLPDIALPVRLFECRAGYAGGSGSYATNALGLIARLERDRAENLEINPFGGTTSLEGRQIPLRIFLFKDGKARSYRTQRHGIVFTINGQMHGSISTDFFGRRSVGMSYLANSLFILVDCTNLDTRMREDLFMTSRDRLRVNPLSEELESALTRFIRDNSKLKEMRNRRQEALRKKRLEDNKPLVEALQGALKNDPTLERLLLKGLDITSPFPRNGGPGKGKQARFIGKRFPTYFRFEGRETGEVLTRDAHEGSRVRVAFETDAVDDYFIRDNDPGYWDVLVKSSGKFIPASNWTTTDPSSGIAQLWLDALPLGTSAGDEVEYIARISDGDRIEPFENRLTLQVRGPQQSGNGGHRRNPETDPSNLNLPTIIPVKKDDWSRVGFTEESVLAVHAAPAIDSESERSFAYDFLINVDNKYLEYEQKTNPPASELLERQFTYGMVIVGLALLRTDSKPTHSKAQLDPIQADDRPEDQPIETRISAATAAIAPVFLPMFRAIGDLANEAL